VLTISFYTKQQKTRSIAEASFLLFMDEISINIKF